MMRSTLSSWFSTTALLLVAGVANAAGPVVGPPMLERTPHTAQIRAYGAQQQPNAVVPHVGPRPVQQKMHVRVNGAQPDSHVVIERQQRSGVAEVGGKVTLDQLKAAAGKATRWQERMRVTAQNQSPNSPHHEVHEDEKLVMWPNSRYRTRATTRDDQVIENHGGIVAGLDNQTETRWNPLTEQRENVVIGGQHLKSARAWVNPENLYVTAPSHDAQMLANGHAKLEAATQKTAILEKEKHDFAQTRAGMDATAQRAKQTEITALEQEITQLKTEGDHLVKEGSRFTVRVASVGALPVHAAVRVQNSRLAELANNGQASLHTLDKVTDADSGFLHESVEAVPKDRIWLSVFFNAQGAQSSEKHVAFRVPRGVDEKESFEMDGHKYYRVVVEGEK
jgi:hypothetical protein